jgi:hypothetical protein
VSKTIHSPSGDRSAERTAQEPWVTGSGDPAVSPRSGSKATRSTLARRLSAA